MLRILYSGGLRVGTGIEAALALQEVVWEERREAIERELLFQLDRITRDAPFRLAEAMRYSLLAPGKRLRPILTLLAVKTVGGAENRGLAAGCAVEMVHAYSLIHDDLPAMDDDDLRRGLPTCHKKFGEALAILAGDALLTGAFETLAASYTERTAAVGVLELSRGAGAAGMVGGQVIDLQADGRIPPEERAETGMELLAALQRRKTGALIRSAIRLGVAVAEEERPVEEELRSQLDRYADLLGQAFQATDDLLDASGTSAAAGKKVGKDRERGKLTAPGLIGLEAARVRADELTAAAVSVAESWERGGELASLARAIGRRDR